ncbi:MAG TPA: PqqD family protein, partial [Rhodospirillales bacterium]|nr:PqqD family protein [Rhodospirillales bacterium]
MAVLNPPARFACEALVAGRSVTDIADEYARRFGRPPAEAEADLRALDGDLRRLLRSAPAPREAVDAPSPAAAIDLRGVYAVGPRTVRLTVRGSPRLARLLRFLLEPAVTERRPRLHLVVTKQG